VNLGRPIVTSGAFVASLCGSAYGNRAVVWRGEWVGAGIDVLDGIHVPQGEGLFLAFFGICAHIRLNGQNDVRNVFDLCMKI